MRITNKMRLEYLELVGGMPVEPWVVLMSRKLRQLIDSELRKSKRGGA